jgi:signal peptidase I
LGRQPERGDIVIVTPPGTRSDYIKRVIGLPGDTIQMVDGTLIINGQRVKREARPPGIIPIDPNSPCGKPFPGDSSLLPYRTTGPGGRAVCQVPVVHEWLPNGRNYDTVELGRRAEDNFGPIRIPPDTLWLMGDNRDDSADSRVAEAQGGLGGPVPWENIGGRAEFITFSLDGSTIWWNPLTWFEAFRSGRAGTSLRRS